ncbi:hypothetical protein ABW21_db0205740 [Orbilia brochopaga]|nr:hypothetical protein ABW21_db0205740 [Drechslerella brochopaga]
MRFTSMKWTDIPRSYLLIALVSFVEPSYAFYRLWGYTDLQGNPLTLASLKAQALGLNRNSRSDLKALCHSFPDPRPGTELGILRVAAFMNHGSNPVQAVGFWQEPDFNCGKAAPQVILYLKPGFEAQAVDLRPFGAESVYTNWKQILPTTAEWIRYVAPELIGDRNLGGGFVKILDRNAEDHSVVEGSKIVWDTQVEETAWETSKRPGELARESAKNFFENFFKTEMVWIQSNTTPLSQEDQQKLQLELDAFRQALQERLQLWEAKRARNNQASNQNTRLQNPGIIQMSNFALSTLPRIEPYPLFGAPYYQQGILDGQLPGVGLGFGNINFGNGEDTIEVKKIEDIPNTKQEYDRSIEEIIKEETAIPQTKEEAEDIILGGPAPEGIPLTIQDPQLGTGRRTFQPLILTAPPTDNMMTSPFGRAFQSSNYNPLQNMMLAAPPDQQLYQRLSQLQPIVPSVNIPRIQVEGQIVNAGTNLGVNPLQGQAPYYGVPFLQPPYANQASLNTKRPLPGIEEPVFEQGEEEAIIDSRKRYFTNTDSNNPIVVDSSTEPQRNIRPDLNENQMYIQDLFRRIDQVEAMRAGRTALRRQLTGQKSRTQPRTSALERALESYRRTPAPIPADGESPDIPMLRDLSSDEQVSPEIKIE